MSGCGTRETILPFPDLPEDLMTPPVTLAESKLQEKPSLSIIAAQHTKEATLFKENAEKLRSLQQWVLKQKAKYDAAAKKS